MEFSNLLYWLAGTDQLLGRDSWSLRLCIQFLGGVNRYTPSCFVNMLFSRKTSIRKNDRNGNNSKITIT